LGPRARRAPPPGPGLRREQTPRWRCQARLQPGRRRRPADHIEASALAQELLDDEIKFDQDANDQDGACKGGRHDDLVTVLGLAVRHDPPKPAAMRPGYAGPPATAGFGYPMQASDPMQTPLLRCQARLQPGGRTRPAAHLGASVLAHERLTSGRPPLALRTAKSAQMVGMPL
jgi:hypothetical protein